MEWASQHQSELLQNWELAKNNHETNCAFGVDGGLSMIHDVVSASYKGEYKIEVTFDDGKEGL